MGSRRRFDQVVRHSTGSRPIRSTRPVYFDKNIAFDSKKNLRVHSEFCIVKHKIFFHKQPRFQGLCAKIGPRGPPLHLPSDGNFNTERNQKLLSDGVNSTFVIRINVT